MVTGGNVCNGTECQDAPLALTEKDIPGAALVELFKSHTVTTSLSGYYSSYILNIAHVVKRYGTVVRNVWTPLYGA